MPLSASAETQVRAIRETIASLAQISDDTLSPLRSPNVQIHAIAYVSDRAEHLARSLSIDLIRKLIGCVPMITFKSIYERIYLLPSHTANYDFCYSAFN